jgi:hypothetical protein
MSITQAISPLAHKYKLKGNARKEPSQGAKTDSPETKGTKGAAVCFNPECAITLFDVNSIDE